MLYDVVFAAAVYAAEKEEEKCATVRRQVIGWHGA